MSFCAVRTHIQTHDNPYIAYKCYASVTFNNISLHGKYYEEEEEDQQQQPQQ